MSSLDCFFFKSAFSPLYSLFSLQCFFRDSSQLDPLGIRSRRVHSVTVPQKLMRPGLRQAFLAQRPGQSRATGGHVIGPSDTQLLASDNNIGDVVTLGLQVAAVMNACT